MENLTMTPYNKQQLTDYRNYEFHGMNDNLDAMHEIEDRNGLHGVSPDRVLVALEKGSVDSQMEYNEI